MSEGSIKVVKLESKDAFRARNRVDVADPARLEAELNRLRREGHQVLSVIPAAYEEAPGGMELAALLVVLKPDTPSSDE